MLNREFLESALSLTGYFGWSSKTQNDNKIVDGRRDKGQEVSFGDKHSIGH